MRLIRSASRLQSSCVRAASGTRALSSSSSSSSSSIISPARRYASSSSDEPLQKTALYDLHVSHGGKMVPFGGFHMPVQYASLSVSASHVFTRTHASLFDVSHMVQRIFSGPGAAAFLQRVTPAGLAALPVNSSTLSALLHPGTGGIVDDTVITKLADDEFYVVTNAACRAKDDAYFAEQLSAWDGPAVRHEKQDHKGLIALQGPLSADILASVLAAGPDSPADLTKVFFGTCTTARIALAGGAVSAPVLISRGGYTGEDGFEISIPSAEETVAVTETLLASAGPERLQLAGLGARDSLRLEAGMCLYGHDLDDATTPVEGGLSWIIPKDRRGADAGFHGAEVLAKQLVPKAKGGAGVERRRVGFVVQGAPAREGAEVVSKDGEKIGNITSGCPSPTLGKNIAMGYIKDGFHKSGTEVDVVVRGRNRKAVVSKMPFVPTKYWKGTAPA
ncbi:glycine cleavage system T protein [Cryphonectria parasitica EP155]|uniref:Aminomethyltransferase n=1 Tax=Cryphonectria parasitica (strain ATCC 38755 / EP155) TaxID=660469 RepID=A0A9P5CS25_CRYP1|nr:glycine cleavage system T protein [Cryphonectria parasitica EP155]KAF3769174.1 glycine cleavage system T protein [Cryphonectria parasitica EP155]